MIREKGEKTIDLVSSLEYLQQVNTLTETLHPGALKGQ